MTVTSSIPDLSKPQYFYLKGEWWRLALYGTLSIFLLVLPSAYFSIVIMQQRSLADFSVGAIGMSSFGFWCAQFLLPRYRLDERGVSQRNYLPIWDLWSWKDFADQKVTFHLGLYSNSSRPWWSQHLCLLLNESDSELVKSTIQRIFHPQPPAILPPTIRINKWTIFCRAIELTPHELIVEKKSKIERYAWRDLKRIECWAQDNKDGFGRIRFLLPNKTLTYVSAFQAGSTLRHGQEVEITRYLQTHEIPVLIVDQSRPPVSSDEYYARLEFAQRGWREIYWCCVIMPLFGTIAITLAFIFENRPIRPAGQFMFWGMLALMFIAFEILMLLPVYFEKQRFRQFATDLGLPDYETK